MLRVGKVTKKQIIMNKFYQFWSYLKGHFVDKSSAQINSFFAATAFFYVLTQISIKLLQEQFFLKMYFDLTISQRYSSKLQHKLNALINNAFNQLLIRQRYNRTKHEVSH